MQDGDIYHGGRSEVGKEHPLFVLVERRCLSRLLRNGELDGVNMRRARKTAT
jgi:hypothetical protein